MTVRVYVAEAVSGVYLSNHASLTAANTEAVSKGAGLVIDSDVTLSTNFSVTANFLRFNGGKIALAGYDLTIAGVDAAPDAYWLDVSGGGTLTFTRPPPFISPMWFGAKNDAALVAGTPTGTDSTTAIQFTRDTIAAQAVPSKLIWPAGGYKYSASPNWAINGLVCEAHGRVNLFNTGTSFTLKIDNAPTETNGLKWGMEGGAFVLYGGATSDDGAWLQSVNRSAICVRVAGAGSAKAAVRGVFCVCTDFHIIASANIEAWYSMPQDGIILDKNGSGVFSSQCNIINPIIEGLTNVAGGVGIRIKGANYTNVKSGTSEANVVGYAVDASCFGNRVRDTDFESNSSYDVSLSGQGDTLDAINSNGTVLVQTDVKDVHIVNSRLDSVTVQSGARVALENSSVLQGGGALSLQPSTVLRNVYDETAAAYMANLDNSPRAQIYHSMAYSVSVTIDCNDGYRQVLSVTDGTAFTINEPTNAVDGQEIEFTIYNGSGGALGTVTWDAIFRTGTPPPLPATGKMRTYWIVKDTGSTCWGFKNWSADDVQVW